MVSEKTVKNRESLGILGPTDLFMPAPMYRSAHSLFGSLYIKFLALMSTFLSLGQDSQIV